MPKLIKGTKYHDDLNGTSGNDEIYGLGGNDELGGGAGHDILDGGIGEDEMHGGSGDDVYIVDNVADQVFEYAGEGHDTIKSSISITYLSDYVEDLFLTGSGDLFGYGNWLDNHIYGTAGDNYLFGLQGNDELHGGYGKDHLDGGIGNDTLFGGVGADTMSGGKDNDTYYVDQSGDVVIEAKDEGEDLVHSTVTHALAANVENLTLDGTANIDGAGNGLDNVLRGNAGNNMLFGYDGDDVFIGNGGADSMWGGDGDDRYNIDDNDKIFESANRGTDHVYYNGSSSYTLADNFENLSLYTNGDSNGTGNGQRNEIHGNQYKNIIDGRGGDDVMTGYGGDDTYYVDSENDVVEESASGGVDTVLASSNFTLSADIENLSLAIGNAVYGTGNDQVNTIYGNAGHNVLNGGDGADSLSGLGGDDTFVFNATEAHGDSVYEFEGNGAGSGDVLEFHGFGTAAQGATLTFIGGDAWRVTSADGTIQETIHLIGSPTIDASDYVFV